MQYNILKKIVDYLSENAQNIKFIKRVDNNIIIIEFNNKNIIYFDLNKSNAKIFKSKEQISLKKDFNAPFDVVLQKKFTNSKIESIEIYNNDKIINIKVNSSSSYKKENLILQLEFTGKYTNIIILDKKFIPSCIYSQPQVASMGYREYEIEEKYTVGIFPFQASGKSLTADNKEGFIKVLTNDEGELLGAHIIGPNASEIIHSFNYFL